MIQPLMTTGSGRRATCLQIALLSFSMLTCTPKAAIAQQYRPPYAPGPLPGLVVELPRKDEPDPRNFDEAARLAGEARATIEVGLRTACVDPKDRERRVQAVSQVLWQLANYHDPDKARDLQKRQWHYWLETQLQELEKKPSCAPPAPQVVEAPGPTPMVTPPPIEKKCDGDKAAENEKLVKEIKKLKEEITDLEHELSEINSKLQPYADAAEFFSSGQTINEWAPKKYVSYGEPRYKPEEHPKLLDELIKRRNEMAADPELLPKLQKQSDETSNKLRQKLREQNERELNRKANSNNCPDSPGAMAPRLDSTGIYVVDGYVGLNVGGESQNSMVAWNPNFTPPDNLGVASASRATLNQTGVAVTGQVGADVRFGQVVVGGVFDMTYKGGDPTRVTLYASPFGGVFPMRQNFASSFEMTVRGRVGYEFPISSALSVMPYATAGLAMSNISVSDGMYFPTSFNQGAFSQFKPGWAAGGGVEFRTKWPFRLQLQYLHMDFGNTDYMMPNTTFPTSIIGTHHQISEDRATVGVNVSFDDMPRLLSGRF
jgi:opacity protein-like surface antigen